jgi:hypothetical protein
MNSFLTACLTSVALSSQVVSDGWSAVTVTVDGTPKTLYVAMGSSKSHDTTITIPYNERGYLSNTPSLDPNQFFRPNLLGGSIEFDVDLTTRNCGCVAALYLVGMPGKNQNGDLWNTDGYYYCDAN